MLTAEHYLLWPLTELSMLENPPPVIAGPSECADPEGHFICCFQDVRDLFESSRAEFSVIHKPVSKYTI
jgi:hypothetical protein